LNTSDFTTKDIERFWSKVNCTENSNDCWEWQSGKHRQGYGNFSFKGKNIRSHRVSYVLAYGELLPDTKVLHECDNPACVNPKHLFLGTQQDNIMDMVSKGRQKGASGETNGSAKLSIADIEYIRKRYAMGNITQKTLADQFGVVHQLISQIIRNEIWRTDEDDFADCG